MIEFVQKNFLFNTLKTIFLSASFVLLKKGSCVVKKIRNTISSHFTVSGKGLSFTLVWHALGL